MKIAVTATVEVASEQEAADMVNGWGLPDGTSVVMQTVPATVLATIDGGALSMDEPSPEPPPPTAEPSE
jgi:hypothetical protein